MKLPWTRDEIAVLIPKLKKSIEITEAEDEDIRPLPPMDIEECKELFFRMIDNATNRPLTNAEHCLCGQILANFQHAVRAETLNKKGRYFVLSEDEINGMLQGKK